MQTLLVKPLQLLVARRVGLPGFGPTEKKTQDHTSVCSFIPWFCHTLFVSLLKTQLLLFRVFQKWFVGVLLRSLHWLGGSASSTFTGSWGIEAFGSSLKYSAQCARMSLVSEIDRLLGGADWNWASGFGPIGSMQACKKRPKVLHVCRKLEIFHNLVPPFFHLASPLQKLLLGLLVLLLLKEASNPVKMLYVGSRQAHA